MEKKLYRDMNDKKIAGVCSGIGKYFDIDPTVIRLAWLLFICLGGSGLIAYFIAWVIIPEATYYK